MAGYFGGDLSGTARFVGMGGSMAALGADISVMGVNPAGIGLYRSNDLAVSAGISTQRNRAVWHGEASSSGKDCFSFDNIGVVMAFEPDMWAVDFMNIGVSYRRRADMQREFGVSGALYGSSQTDIMQRLYDYAPFDITRMTWEDYVSGDYSWLSLLAADGGLLDPHSDPQGALMYRPTGMEYFADEDGGVDEILLDMAFNLRDRLYMGIAIGCHSVDYSRYSRYSEYDGAGRIYTLHNRFATKGEGFDIRLGVILRPIEESSLRIGMALHSPVWYSLTDISSAAIDGLETDYSTGYMDTRDYDFAYGDDMRIDYRMTTPIRINLSAAYTVGTYLALNAEYEYADYTKAGVEYADGGGMPDVEYDMEHGLRCVNTYRAGAELALGRGFRVRAGYNHTDAPFRRQFAKSYFTKADTRTEYMNRMDMQNYTLGLGYSGKRFYVDAAFIHNRQDAEFSPFTDINNNDMPANVETERNRFIMTVGMRFAWQ